ncbi:hypothetical protein PoB_002745200 [Plakobranchus ocellatus]|uniref:Uncharacterized protein n=1 Tax=Plakobranchus ocellatus TaxID=259542 RepID=A0AAV4A222_9GAST|nr:hypothetical protein PoB_002745200 [Plakobranchus ocellatus]
MSAIDQRNQSGVIDKQHSSNQVQALSSPAPAGLQESTGGHSSVDEYVAHQGLETSSDFEAEEVKRRIIEERVTPSTDDNSNLSSIIVLPAISPKLRMKKLLEIQREPDENSTSGEEYVPSQEEKISSETEAEKVKENLQEPKGDWNSFSDKGSTEDYSSSEECVPSQEKKISSESEAEKVKEDIIDERVRASVCVESDDDYVPSQAEASSSESETEEHDIGEPVGATACDNSSAFSILLPPPTSTQFGIQKCQVAKKRVYDKKHCCVFCNKLVSKIARHLEQMHSSEPEVALALILPKASKERKNKFNEILKRGDFAYNKKVMETKSGLIIPHKRSAKSVDATNYIPCCHCYGMYLQKDLWRHVKNCHKYLHSQESDDKYVPSQAKISSSESETEEHDIGEPVGATAGDNSSASSILPPPTSTQFGVQKYQVAKKRIYDKKHCCVFCNKLVSKIARHLEQMHASEPEVALALMLPKASKERKNKFSEILKRGDFAYNKKVMETKSGLIIPRKRPAKSVDATNYLPCSHCFGMYLRKDLWRLEKNCHKYLYLQESDDKYVPPQAKISSSESETEEHDIGEPMGATAGVNSSASSILLPPPTSTQIGIKKCQVSQKRIYDKKHCCVFCNKLVTKIARHLEQMHASEPEVALALMLPKASEERKNKFSEILKRGDFAYNKKVMETKSGLIIPHKGPAKSVDATNYISCCHCFGMYLRKDLWRHVKHCHKYLQDSDDKHVPPQAEISSSESETEEHDIGDPVGATAARHLEHMHASEPEVALALILPKASKERKNKFCEILKRGDFAYNKKVMETKSGLIIPRKRPAKSADATNYLPCCHCFGMYLRKDLWRHVKNCRRNYHSHEGISHQALGKMLLPVSYDVSDKFKSKILSSMGMDEITSIVKGDALVLAFGERLFIKVGAKQHQFNYIKQKLRELGRFLSNVKNKSSKIKSLKDCIDPSRFQEIVASVRDLCKCDADGNYGIPSLALKIGLSLKKCALLLKSQAIQDENEQLKQKAASFLELYPSVWAAEISSVSLQTIQE